jgi:hypothetical protein
MQKKPPEPTVSPAPPPSAESPSDGLLQGRGLARRYLADVVRLWAGIALGKDTEASLHTRFLAGNAIANVAGAIPQPTPSAPLAGDGAGDGGAA